MRAHSLVATLLLRLPLDRPELRTKVRRQRGCPTELPPQPLCFRAQLGEFLGLGIAAVASWNGCLTHCMQRLQDSVTQRVALVVDDRQRPFDRAVDFCLLQLFSSSFFAFLLVFHRVPATSIPLDNAQLGDLWRQVVLESER